MPKRSLPAPATVALDVIALMGKRRLPLNEFELRMHERGCGGRTVAAAVAALERRGWAARLNGSLEITDSGYDAASRGAQPPPAKRAAPRQPRRMPRGLFN